MDDAAQKHQGQDTNSENSHLIQPPSISLPKGGGAVRGIGEKFAANPVTGTGSMSVPIPTSPGRVGFGPQLSLTYDSGAGNGPFGFGWSLALPSITRKTNKGLPQYRDNIDSDVFLLSDAEDLVPEKHITDDLDRLGSIDGRTYTVRRYRPRLEGLFSRIERWTNVDDPQDVHWRSITKDNVLTVYGRDSRSRIFDPENPEHIFSWLISETQDAQGNGILYVYKPDDGVGADLSQNHERNRGTQDDPGRKANRYIKRIRYGNKETLLTAGQRSPLIREDQIDNTHWMFEVVFDYGEHDQFAPSTDDSGQWTFRQDAFSNYRSGFEVRTTRLCQRVLIFHHFPSEEIGANCLVRSTDFTYSHDQGASGVRSAVYTFLQSVTQSGHKKLSDGTYQKRSLPPVEFIYSSAEIQDTVEIVDPESMENLPIGLDGTRYQWTDLHGEGISGILSEQGGTWHYKRNLSPLNVIKNEGNPRTQAKFASTERVATMPNAALSHGAQFMDLAGDGLPDLVTLDGPSPGFYEHDQRESWQAFRAFTLQLTRNMRDRNLRLVDLTGDGRADVLITEDDALVWYPSAGEAGFEEAQRVAQALDEEHGPRLIFADGTQSIYLTDISGDGLTDLARIRNGEICYWPNLGYGRFGAKVTMDHAPYFDHPDQFDYKRLRLADIDGSGTTDVIYLHRDGVRLYFNQSGNGWSDPQIINVFPAVHNLANIQVVDLLGNGTACLVWSSTLPADRQSPMRYVNLMGDQKPHLLVKVKNNLGAETEIQYAPSTKFYLQDKQAGTPWITRLPFPVHVVETVTVKDKWRETSFSQTYSYHHGYFDGVEREFRGFGRVDQIDIEHFGRFSDGNSQSPYIAEDHELYQPPVKTVTWFHTGAFIDRNRILSQYEHEYFPNWFERQIPDVSNVLGDFRENSLPEPDITPSELTSDEWREALRACKGMTLRQEIYELDVDALERGAEQPVKLFSAAYHNCHIRMLQPKGDNQHAVFMVTESEAITYHYELDLRKDTVTPDPRVSHNLNLRIDDYGNVLQSVAVVYPRIGNYEDESLDDDTHNKISDVQSEMHIRYTETHYTEDVDDDDHYRLRVPCEVQTYELTGINPQDADDITTADPRDDLYFTLDELQKLWLSPTYQSEGDPVDEIGYHELPDRTRHQKRLVEHVRMLFFDIDESLELNNPLPLGRINYLGLPYETYKLALTTNLLEAVLGDRLALLPEADETIEEMRNRILAEGGYHFQDGAWWIRSGIAGFAPDAAEHFFLPERYIDPFDNTTTLEYDGNYSLFIRSSIDPLGNRVSVRQFNYRVLAPQVMEDINGNISEVAFDTLGMPVASALRSAGDSLDHITTDVDVAELIRLFADEYDEYDERQLTQQLETWLDDATARHVYYFGEKRETDGSFTYGHHPPCAVGILREQHVSELSDGEQSPLQVAFEYSDGGGKVLVKKAQAEPEEPGGSQRWIATGKTILNNKGKPVKQYEPYFSINEITREPTYRFEEPLEMSVTPIMYYDAPGRLVRTEFPDGTFSRMEFSPWHVTSFDQNDTVRESDWYADRSPPDPEDSISGDMRLTADQRAAWLTAHHHNTPATTILDSLGREVITIAHNRVQNDTGTHTHGGQRYEEVKYVTFTRLDAEGKPLWIRDARGNLVMQYITPQKATVWAAEENEAVPAGAVPCYDISGNLLFQHSMDAGNRWMLMDSTGEPYYAWDENEVDGGTTPQSRIYHTTYDELRRPTEQQLSLDGGTTWNVIERYQYRDPALGSTSPDREAEELNLGGQVYRRYDSAGLVTNEQFDFKGNLLETTRRFVNDYAASIIHWPEDPPSSAFEPEVFTQRTEYDALNRMTRHENWHLAGREPAVYVPQYNRRGLLLSETLSVHGETSDAIERIEYNAKGQRTYIEHGNGTITRYHYDEQTFRLKQLRTTRNGFDPPFSDFHSDLSHEDVLQQLNYTYDPSGNITEIYDEAYEPVFFRNQRVEPRSRYVYDPLYRLIEASGREQYEVSSAPRQIEDSPLSHQFPRTDQALHSYTQRYTYDSVGNIMEMRHIAHGASADGWTRRYTYADDSNRLVQTSTNNLRETINYRYDTHGNMLNLNNVPPEFLLRWDYRDMIHTSNLGGGGQVYYSYCKDKQRRRKRIERTGGIVEERFYLDGMEWYRRWEGGSVVEEIETHHLFVDDQRVLMVEDVLQTNDTDLGTGVLYRYQYGNHLGSVGLELNGDADIISYEEYHPYGTTAYHATNRDIKRTAKRYRYTGMERDEETGLSYHTARYYMPWLGRWCSTDPRGQSGGVNLYVYTNNNPIKFHDHTGQIPASAAQSPESHIQHLRSLQANPPSEDERFRLLSRFQPSAANGRAFYTEMAAHSGTYWNGRILQHINNSQNQRSLARVEQQLQRMHNLPGASDIPVLAGLVIGLREAGGAIYGRQPRYPFLAPAEASRLRREYRGIADSFWGGGFDNLYSRQVTAEAAGFLPQVPGRYFQEGEFHGDPNNETDDPDDTIQSVRIPHNEAFMAATAEAAWAYQRFTEAVLEQGYLQAEINALTPLARNFLTAVAFQTPGGAEWSDYEGGTWGLNTLLSYMHDNNISLNRVLEILEFGDDAHQFRDRGIATRTAIRTAVIATQFERSYSRQQRGTQAETAEERQQFDRLIHQLAE